MLHAGFMPLPRLVVCLIAGICARRWLGLDVPLTVFLLLFVPGLLFTFLPSVYVGSYPGRWRFGMLSALLFLLCGYLLAQLGDLNSHSLHFSRHEQGQGLLLLQLTRSVSEKQNSYQLTARVDALFLEDKSFKTTGKLMVYLEKDSVAAALRYGDVVLIENIYEKTSPPDNPHQFDYSRYLAGNNIFHTTYRQSGRWQYTGKNHGIFLFRWSEYLHERALHFFGQQALNERDYAVLSALLLGYREMLDDELRDAFAGAGAMHVLCVSGLHVGIIFVVLSAVFAFIDRFPGGRYLKPVVIVSLIWFYAAITGFSPSVMRAATMFSFVAAGQCMRRAGNIYNTLSASALLLLLADPLVISRIGFQLSYLAVLGIVSIQPWMYDKLKPPNKLMDRIWAIMTVSVAAQLATGPLSLYYFNQFPNYFLLTNLIVIPLSAGIIYAALLAFAFCWFPFVSELVITVLSWLLTGMHVSATRIEALPFAVTTAVDINIFETIMLFGLILGGYFYLLRKMRPAFIYLLLCVLMLAASLSARSISLFRQPQFVVYSINAGTAIDFFSDRKEGVSILCQKLRDDSLALRFNASQHRIRRGVPEPEVRAIAGGFDTALRGTWAQQGAFIRFLDKTMLIVTGEEPDLSLTDVLTAPDMGFSVDFLIVGGQAGYRPEDMIRVYLPGRVIISADTPPWVVRQWLELCEGDDIPVWVVREQGAFVQCLKQSG